jgi:autotransporter passenger strand-loop-strand repeat protein
VTTVGGGQSVTILSGQAGDGDTILNGGTETVDHGGVSRRPVIDGGLLFDDGFVDRGQVSGGGVLFDSGFDYRMTVASGGIVYVEPDGKARRTVVDSGGTVYDGDTVNRATVNSGGVLYVGGAVTISGMTSDSVGSADGTVIRGATEYVLSGTDTNARIGNGGFEYVDSGGTAIHTMIRHGGELVVSSGGIANATVIGRGGLELVMSGGFASGAIIDRGGTLEFAAADAGVTQDIQFSDVGWGAAVVKFDAAATASGGLIYDGVISGFDSSYDEIDLAGLGFVSGQTAATSVLSGSNTILTITNGTQTVALTLAGNRTSDAFAVSSDSTVMDTTPGEDSPLGWLGSHVASVVSDLYDFDSEGGFSHLVDWIDGRHSSSDPGPTPPSDHPPPIRSAVFQAPHSMADGRPIWCRPWHRSATTPAVSSSRARFTRTTRPRRTCRSWRRNPRKAPPANLRRRSMPWTRVRWLRRPPECRAAECKGLAILVR